MRKIIWLNSLRGLACLIVLSAHIISIHPIYKSYVNGCGKIGVWFFMLISGFLVMYSDYRDEEPALKKIANFYGKKIIRVYPMYLLVLLFAFLLGFFKNNNLYLKNALFIEGSRHFWYMPVIIKFYLISPVFFIIRDKVKKEWKWNVFLFGIITLLSINFPFSNYKSNSIQLWWYLPVFCMGMITEYIYSLIEKRQSSWLFGDFVAILSMCSIILMTPFMKYWIFNIKPSNYLQNKYLIIGLLWAVVFLGISGSKYIKTFLNKCSVLQFIGNISYPVYLVHYVIMMKLKKMGITWNITAIITITISIGVGFLLSIINNYIVKKVKELIL